MFGKESLLGQALGIIKDENGKVSSTRIILIVNTIILIFFGQFAGELSEQVQTQVTNIIQTVFGVGLGGQAVRSGMKNLKSDK